MPLSPHNIAHFFTVDVEEHFQVSAFEGIVERESWATQPSRVERNVDRALALLADANATATFFTLGWVAERRPALVRRIAECGHEIASHGMTHRRVYHLSSAEFRDELRTSKRLLEDITGTHVVGFRAPNFSILPRSEWAFEVLVEEGYRYDSSRFPIHRIDYGSPDAPSDVHVVTCPSGTLLEFPLATYKAFGARIPAAGAAYLRHFPYRVVRGAFAQSERRGQAAVFYIHPWELDPEQPRIDAPLLTRWRHYTGLSRTTARVARLLGEFRFTSFRARLERPAPRDAVLVA
ncbi:MAG TPA: XrtA system polysaccharide deacetylase [Gemmatimonadaceae bacterium]|nr:XrtA system polysaccharide deacetylase [Gemmatimonadaceae bacterium]